MYLVINDNYVDLNISKWPSSLFSDVIKLERYKNEKNNIIFQFTFEIKLHCRQ